MQHITQNALKSLTYRPFPEDCGALNAEHDERFHEKISVIKHRYGGRFSALMLADFCCTLQKDSNLTHNRQAKRNA